VSSATPERLEYSLTDGPKDEHRTAAACHHVKFVTPP
jgi:hypothetical protein